MFWSGIFSTEKTAFLSFVRGAADDGRCQGTPHFSTWGGASWSRSVKFCVFKAVFSHRRKLRFWVLSNALPTLATARGHSISGKHMGVVLVSVSRNTTPCWMTGVTLHGIATPDGLSEIQFSPRRCQGTLHSYFTESVYNVVSQKSIPAQIRRLILCY